MARIGSIPAVLLALAAAGLANPAAAMVAAAQIAVPVVKAAPPINGQIGPEWKGAAAVPLTYDLKLHAAAGEPTKAYVMTDGKALFVAFDASQTRAPIHASQLTNNVGQDTDDEVAISLWPSGTQGFAYQFISTPAGTRYQNSSENPNYEPSWESSGRIDGTHYTVTMRIPFRIMRVPAHGKWLVQLSRFEPTTGANYVSNGGADMQGVQDTNYAQPLGGMPAITAARPQPRFAAYALGAIAAPSAGGSTSRAGLDFAIPVTSGTSIVGTIHPDFSNVENDQQSISPNAFARYYQETRPFFAQGAGAYNYYECDQCQNISTLYTPGIPTPRSGYAVEGKEGRFTFGGFDSDGVGRNDAAASIVYRTLPRTLFYSYQHVAVNMPGLKDDTDSFSTKWTDQKHLFAYANFSQETGTNVTDPGKAKMQMVGAGYYTANTFTGGNTMRMGSQFNPYDGFVTLNDQAGYGVFHSQTWNPTGGAFKRINLVGFVDRYHGSQNGINNADQAVLLDATTRSLWDVQLATGSAYTLVNGVVTPLTQNTYTLTYRSGTATPTSIGFGTGAYGDGRLDAWYRSTTFRIGRALTMTLEADDTQQFLTGGGVNTQWLERASVAFQTSRESSLAIGLRRFTGTPPSPTGGGQCSGVCTNVSFAFHKRVGKRELYIAYGNPSPLFTTPQFLVKVIDYIGADKGT